MAPEWHEIVKNKTFFVKIRLKSILIHVYFRANEYSKGSGTQGAGPRVRGPECGAHLFRGKSMVEFHSLNPVFDNEARKS
jgi:hypothetical protein